MSDVRAQDVGAPDTAGDSRSGARVALVVIGDGVPGPAALPHYYIDRLGAVSRLVSEKRAGRGLGKASHQGVAQRIDTIAVSVLLQKRPTAGYDGPLLRSLDALLDGLLARLGLDVAAISRVVRDANGAAQVVPYVPPPAPRLH